MLRFAALLLLAGLLAGCGRVPAVGQVAAAGTSRVVPIEVRAAPLHAPPGACSGSFVAHDLPHVTTVPGDGVEMFEANGAGVAINDLDEDGDLDLVLANHHDPNTILWNDGGLRFHKQSMPHGDSRAVNVVDVDGDGRLDIVFTRRMSGLNYWQNTGKPERAERFERLVLPGIAKPAYAINWDDADGDGDLDLVGASYDAGLLTDLGSSFLFSGAGVYYYEQRESGFRPELLAREAQALAVDMFDANGDGRRDILVGNDFAVRDGVWLRDGSGWTTASPFGKTSHSTMSLDHGDVDNDGDFELFSTDMKPYDLSVATQATWRVIMVEMWDPPQKGDPQIMENVLQVRDAHGKFHNQAYERRVDATGWSWSGKFGDLDNDGFLDLYVVNGMIEAEIFHYLPRHELVEENQALRNDGAGRFVPAHEWGLGSELSGRGMSMGDLDLDGDLDIVVNNLRGPAQLFENRLCGGSSLEIDLRWLASKNSRALGATLALRTDGGTYLRDVRAASGYLSGDPARIHFGVPPGATPRELEIRWPDGAVSVIEGPAVQQLITVTRR